MTAPAHAPSRPKFFLEYLRDLKVAAIAPSSAFLVRRLLRRLDPSRRHLVLELGPGDGVATSAVLAALPADARLVAVERNPHFAAALKQWTDPRLTALEGDARAAGQLGKLGPNQVDAVLASIPFTYLNKADRAALTATAKRLLKPGGIFIVFHQYSPLMLPYMKKEFGNVTAEFEPLNVFPCFLMTATKK